MNFTGHLIHSSLESYKPVLVDQLQRSLIPLNHLNVIILLIVKHCLNKIRGEGAFALDIGWSSTFASVSGTL